MELGDPIELILIEGLELLKDLSIKGELKELEKLFGLDFALLFFDN